MICTTANGRYALLDLTLEQAQMLTRAMLAVSPSGGSSPTSTCAYEMIDGWKFEETPEHVASTIKMIETAHEEWVEAHA